MNDKKLTVAGVFVLMIFALFFAGCTTKTPVKECSLSLCDCKCYPKGETPEEKDGRLCGINCLGEKGVAGCEYQEGKCVEIFSNQTPAKCSLDSECVKEENKCADGVDPYHVCREGKCVQLTFVADPCLMEHTCPKGVWTSKTESTCFRYENCAEKGCDDHSDATKDECTGIGTRSEGCMYTLVDDLKACTRDSECVPEQCCHPTSCINARYKKPCNVLCTQVCEGPIDCGAGRCACIEGKCSVEKLNTQ